MNNSIVLFRYIALIEGISYLALIGIAMPIKYLLHLPEPVKYTGWAHGVLFIGYFLLLATTSAQHAWPLKRVLRYALLSFIPFGTFWMDKELKKLVG